MADNQTHLMKKASIASRAPLNLQMVITLKSVLSNRVVSIHASSSMLDLSQASFDKAKFAHVTQLLNLINYHFSNLSFLLCFLAETAGIRAMFYHPYEPIEEENESKLSSQGSIRTDLSNTDESFNLDVQQYVDFCDEPNED